jgi:hypothetical protein|tara:strand:+ start:78 stop:305 length:228 start_codon:yes stop_codon:yes gene_type:complete
MRVVNVLIEIIVNHIKTWNMVWFGLIFWGSILNGISTKSGLPFTYPNISFLCFAIGLIFGLLAKYRGTWLWKLKK